jgi:hypothetical protein
VGNQCLAWHDTHVLRSCLLPGSVRRPPAFSAWPVSTSDGGSPISIRNRMLHRQDGVPTHRRRGCRHMIRSAEWIIPLPPTAPDFNSTSFVLFHITHLEITVVNNYWAVDCSLMFLVLRWQGQRKGGSVVMIAFHSVVMIAFHSVVMNAFLGWWLRSIA